MFSYFLPKDRIRPLKSAISNKNIRIYNVSQIDGEYKEISISFGSDSTIVKYKESPYGYYVQPTKPHFKYGFEEFFGFGCGNYGFDENTTVFVGKYCYNYLPVRKAILDLF